jgi:competence protein ComGC
MKYILLIFAVLLMVACQNYKKQAEQLEQKVDSLQSVTAQTRFYNCTIQGRLFNNSG